MTYHFKLKDFYYEKIYMKGCPEFENLDDSTKIHLQRTLSFNLYLLNYYFLTIKNHFLK